MKRKHFLIPIVILFSALLISMPLAQEKADTSAKPDTADDKSDDAKKEKKTDEDKAFDDVIEKHTVIEGLFTLYHNEKDNSVLMEIKPDQLDKIFLCGVTREAGDGFYYDSGSMQDEFPFVLKKVGKKIQFIHKNVYYRADPNRPISRAVDRGLTSSIVGSAKLESEPHPDRKSFLVNLDGFFLQDYTNVAYAMTEFRKVPFKFDKEESYFSVLKSFPDNTEVGTTLHFTTSKPKPTLSRLPDGRSMQHRYRFSLSTLPTANYRPRLADDRVGHFLTMYQDYSHQLSDTPYIYYINRWHLEKRDPQARVSKPKEPIVFWLENTVPDEYRDAVRRGTLLWNTAFEKAGFKDAIVVKQQPDDADWDPADVRYNTIRWIVVPGAGYAVGPSRANPFTGQIYDADIRISADFVRYWVRLWSEYVDPLTEFKDALNEATWTPGSFLDMCNYSQGKSQQAAFGWSLLSTRGTLDPNSAAGKQYIEDALVDLVAHEVGHTLGLRHNFRASTIHTPDELHNEKITTEEGISGSVMDYNPINLARKGEKQGSYWCTTLGTYDYWAIEYAYTPFRGSSPEDEIKELEKIASRVTDPKLVYGTDEDAIGLSPRGIDPTANLWDLGAEPLEFYRERLVMADELINSIEGNFEIDGERYQKMRLVFGRAWSQYRLAAATVPKYIGGVYYTRDHVGDHDSRTPFEPVSAEKQREAMAFLTENILGPDAFDVPPGLMRKLVPERFYDFNWSIYYMPRIDYPMHTAVGTFQIIALNRLYHPIPMNRMVDLELYYEDPAALYSLAEMFMELRQAIWAELGTQADVNSYRRNLQRAHLGKLVALAVDPKGSAYYTPYSGSKPAGFVNPPADATTLARADLVALRSGIEGALDNSMLGVTARAHLEESLARIDAALSANVQRRM